MDPGEFGAVDVYLAELGAVAGDEEHERELGSAPASGYMAPAQTARPRH